MKSTYEEYVSRMRQAGDLMEAVTARFDVLDAAVEKEGINVWALEGFLMSTVAPDENEEDPLRWFFRVVVPKGDATLFWDAIADALDGYEQRHNSCDPIISTRVRAVEVEVEVEAA